MAGYPDRRDDVRKTIEMLHRMNRAHRRLVERRFLQSGVGIHGGQHRLLMTLDSLGPAPAQTELARHMDISPASVANMLKKLETDGYIERRIKSDDERCNEVRITSKGEAEISASKQIFAAVDSTMLLGFSDEDLCALSGYFERITENIRHAEEEG